MSLQELEEHILSQTLKINQFVNEPSLFANFVDVAHVPSWATFRDSLWGDTSALAPLELDIDVEGDGEPPRLVVKLPETLPDVWAFQSSHVLVRSEYEEAEQAALKAIAKNVDAFLVFGQSGIGLPLLLVIIIRRS
jgi:hypothetical protein